MTGYAVMLDLNGAAGSWQSNHQAVTALSSAEAEYYAALALGCNITYWHLLLDWMGYQQLKPTRVA